MNEDSQDPATRWTALDLQTLVDNGKVSRSSLDVPIEGMNITLNDYYEGIRPPDDLA